MSVYLGGTWFGLMPLFQPIYNGTFLRCEFFTFHFQNLNVHNELQLYIALSLISLTCSDAQSTPIIPHLKCLTELFQYCGECVNREDLDFFFCRSA